MAVDDLFTDAELDQEILARRPERKPGAPSAPAKKPEAPAAAPTGRRLFIVDGYSLIYRSYFAFVTRPLTDSEGNNISSFFGFFNTIFMLLRDYKFDYFVVALDSHAPTFRHEMYPEYKANREAAPEDLHSQVPMVTEALEKMNIPSIAKEGYEADDLIATLAANATRLGVETVMVTGDKDLLQLVGGSVKALRPPKKNQPRYTLFGPDEVYAEFGVKPGQIVDYLSLLGDSSDNVPGVKGIGEKGAVKLLSEYVSLDGIYRHLDSLPKGARAKLEEGRESAYLSRDLVKLKDDVFTLDTFESPGFKVDTIDYKAGAEIFARRGCPNLARTSQMLAGGGPAPEVPAHEAPMPEARADASLVGLGEYSVITTITELRGRFEEARRAGGKIAFDTETTDLDTARAELVGFSIAYAPKKAWYCPIKAAGRDYLPLEEVKEVFAEYFTSGKLEIVGQNTKFDLEVLATLGVHGARVHFDTMIAAWLLDSSSSAYSLESLALRYLNYEAIAYADIVPKGRDFSYVPLEEAVKYGAEDSDLAWRLHLHFSSEMAKRGLDKVWLEYEKPLIPVLVEMEGNGVALDFAEMAHLDKTFSERQAKLEEQIHKAAGKDFNINSTQQLGKVLFEDLGLPAGKKTQRGWSTATETLEGLKGMHPIVELILEYRGVSKLLSTYVDTLPGLAGPDGRVHTSFLQTGTATGRLSSKNPNLQNIPIRSDDGRLIRSAFTAAPGKLFLSADYSQIELVVLAHVSGDEALRKAFRDGGDVHRYTASLIFDKPQEEIQPSERRVAKTINFGIMYGMSAFRLAGEIGVSRADAAGFIERYFDRYSGVRDYISKVVKDAEAKGYVETLGGHVRAVQGIDSRNKNVKQAAERVALNTIIQGSAAELMKKAMVSIHSRLSESGLRAKLLLQVHDELIFEAPEEEIPELERIVRAEMEGAATFSVPLKVGIETGRRWGDMH